MWEKFDGEDYITQPWHFCNLGHFVLNQKESLYRLHIHDNIYYKVKENDPKFNKSKYKSELLVIKFDIL